MRSLSPHAALLFVLLAALLLRCTGLSELALWYDEEAYTLAYARGTWADLLAERTDHPPGYPLLAKLVFGAISEPWALRLPAVLGGLLGIAAAYACVLQLAGKRSALLAAGLLGASVFHVYYSQEARPYTWLSAAVGWSLFFALRLSRSGRARDALWLVGCSLAAVASHYFAAPSVGALLVLAFGLGLARAEARERRRLLGMALGGVLAIAAFALSQSGRWEVLSSLYTSEATTRVAPSPRFLGSVAGRFLGFGAALGLPVLAVCAVGLVATARLRPRAALLVLAAAGAPILMIWVLPWGRFIDARYLQGALVPLAGLFALGAAALARPLAARLPDRPALRLPLALLGAAACLAWPAVATARYLSAPAKQYPTHRTSPFGYSHIVFNSRLDPWALRARGTTDFELRVGVFAGVHCGVPDGWEIISQSASPDGRVQAVKFAEQPRSSDLFTVGLSGLDMDPLTLIETSDLWRLEPRAAIGDVRAFEFVNAVTGESIGRHVLRGDCPALERRIVVDLWSVRPAMAQRMLTEVARSLRCP